MIFKIGNEFFTGKINVENVTKGKKFKDITEIKNTTQEQTNSYGKNPTFRFLRSNSMPNITNIEANSKQSLEVDTEGNKLSEGQREYFKDTKAVDEDGNLLKMYHGTVSDFTVFDRKYGNVEGDWGKGFYFTNMEYDADDNYGNEGGQDLTILERPAKNSASFN